MVKVWKRSETRSTCTLGPCIWQLIHCESSEFCYSGKVPQSWYYGPFATVILSCDDVMTAWSSVQSLWFPQLQTCVHRASSAVWSRIHVATCPAECSADIWFKKNQKPRKVGFFVFNGFLKYCWFFLYKLCALTIQLLFLYYNLIFNLHEFIFYSRLHSL